MKRFLPKRVPSSGHLHRCHNRPETLQIQGTNHLWISSESTNNTSAAWKSALETLFSPCRILDDLLVGCSGGCYRVVGNKISTCKSALITAQLWLVRPRGNLEDYVNCSGCGMSSCQHGSRGIPRRRRAKCTWNAAGEAGGFVWTCLHKKSDFL